jgi:hypothetical protein
VPGWAWRPKESSFDEALAALLRFVADHGRTPTQRDAGAGGERLGAWCNRRRLQHKAGALPADRVAALEGVPGWWWSAGDMPADAQQERDGR